MAATLFSEDVVILARQFNPSIITELWLADAGIVQREHFKSGSIYTPAFVHVHTELFDLVVLTDRLQLTPTGPEDQRHTVVTGTVATIVDTLPHTPFIASGLNFVWHLEPEGTTVHELSRDLLCRQGTTISNEFAGEDARYGAYFSKDAFGGRLRLEIKPQTRHPDKIELLRFAFNFEVPLDDDPVKGIHALLGHWVDARNMSQRMVEAIKYGD